MDIYPIRDPDYLKYLLKDGSRSLTGTISGITPTEDSHLATYGAAKEYADDLLAASLIYYFVYDDDLKCLIAELSALLAYDDQLKCLLTA